MSIDSLRLCNCHVCVGWTTLSKLSLKQRVGFLASIESGNTVQCAAKSVGLSRQAFYKRRLIDTAFADDWDDAAEAGTQVLEQEATRRAMDGSDGLLMFLLKARRPAVYRENLRHVLSGPEGGPIAVKTFDYNNAIATIAGVE